MADPLEVAAEKSVMWEWAKILLDRAPFYAFARSLAGLALGLAVGGLYGALCGGLLAMIEGKPVLFVGWFVLAAGAGTAVGFIMGLCSAIDRASWPPIAPPEPQRRPTAQASTKGHAVSPRLPVPDRSRQFAMLAVVLLSGLLGSGPGTTVA
jgi:hypothetical protein